MFARKTRTLALTVSLLRKLYPKLQQMIIELL